jgi:L-lactate dehydrogenase complex protein LldG
MEKETLVRTAGAVGATVRFLPREGLEAAMRELVAGRTACVAPGLGLAAPGPAAAPADAEVGIARARLWVEETATALVAGSDLATLLPPVGILIVSAASVVPCYDDLVDHLKAHPDEWCAAVTGPSRTADIEKVLVIPAHGPRELHLLIVE